MLISGKWGSLAFSLLGLPFLAAGVFMINEPAKSWMLYSRSEKWVAVPAEILSAKLVTTPSNEVGEPPMHRVECRYRYAFNGKTWESDRVGLGTSESSEYDFHNRRFQEIESTRRRRGSWQALVDPNDPSSSVLFRDVDVFMFILFPIGLLFAFIGVAIGLNGLYSMREDVVRAAALGRDPDRPWRGELGWRGFAIKASTRGLIIALWVIGLFLTLAAAVFMIAVWKASDRSIVVLAMGGGLGAMGVTVLAAAIRKGKEHRRCGAPTLRLARIPFVPGTVLKARVRVERTLDPTLPVVCTLTCRHATGSSESLRMSDVYTNTVEVDRSRCRFGAGHASIPVEFDLPESVPERRPEGDDRFQWNLRVTASTPLVEDFDVTFHDLPVFRVRDPSLVDVNPSIDRA